MEWDEYATHVMAQVWGALLTPNFRMLVRQHWENGDPVDAAVATVIDGITQGQTFSTQYWPGEWEDLTEVD